MQDFFNPHYIPIISSTEDLDDRRPGKTIEWNNGYDLLMWYVAAAEKLIMTKILVKLKGTFKIRLFEGQDWVVHKPVHVAPSGGELIRQPPAGRSLSQASTSSTTAGLAHPSHAVPKSVRFNESVFNELTAVPAAKPSTISSASSTSSSRPRVPYQHDHYLSKKPLFDQPKLSSTSAPTKV